MEKIKLDEAKELVNDNISSIFTKKDVLELLERIDNTNTNVKDIFEKIRIDFGHKIHTVVENIVDKDRVTFELNGNEIMVDDLEVDVEVIESVLEEVLDDLEGDLEN